MPNIVNKGNPPQGMVFVYFKYNDSVVSASRYNGYNNVWFKFREGDGTHKLGIVRFTGCGTEYGINVTQDSAKNLS